MGKVYVFCRFWPGFTPQFPFDRFNDLADDQLKTALQTVADAEGPSDEAMEETLRKWRADALRGTPERAEQMLKPPAEPQHEPARLLKEWRENRRKRTPSATTHRAGQIADALFVRKFQELGWLVSPIRWSWESLQRHILLVVPTQETATELVNALAQRYAKDPNCPRFGSVAAETVPRQQLLFDQDADRLHAAARNPSGAGPLVEVARCAFDLRDRLLARGDAGDAHVTLGVPAKPNADKTEFKVPSREHITWLRGLILTLRRQIEQRDAHHAKGVIVQIHEYIQGTIRPVVERAIREKSIPYVNEGPYSSAGWPDCNQLSWAIVNASGLALAIDQILSGDDPWAMLQKEADRIAVVLAIALDLRIEVAAEVRKNSFENGNEPKAGSGTGLHAAVPTKLSPLQRQTAQRLQDGFRRLISHDGSFQMSALRIPAMHHTIPVPILEHIGTRLLFSSNLDGTDWVVVFSPHLRPHDQSANSTVGSRVTELVAYMADAGQSLLPTDPKWQKNYDARWMLKVFELGEEQPAGSSLVAEKLVWIGNINGRMPLRESAKWRTLAGQHGVPFGSTIQSLPQDAPEWYSEIRDIAAASISAIDILLVGGTAQIATAETDQAGAADPVVLDDTDLAILRAGSTRAQLVSDLATDADCHRDTVSDRLPTLIKAKLMATMTKGNGKRRKYYTTPAGKERIPPAGKDST